MAYIITITSKKETDFFSNAKVILESNQYKEISDNCFLGQKPSNTIVNQQLKNDLKYKSDKNICGIEIYHGNVSKV